MRRSVQRPSTVDHRPLLDAQYHAMRKAGPGRGEAQPCMIAGDWNSVAQAGGTALIQVALGACTRAFPYR